MTNLDMIKLLVPEGDMEPFFEAEKDGIAYQTALSMMKGLASSPLESLSSVRAKTVFNRDANFYFYTKPVEFAQSQKLSSCRGRIWVTGLPGSGKSYFANLLMNWGVEPSSVLHTDEFRSGNPCRFQTLKFASSASEISNRDFSVVEGCVSDTNSVLFSYRPTDVVILIPDLRNLRASNRLKSMKEGLSKSVTEYFISLYTASDDEVYHLIYSAVFRGLYDWLRHRSETTDKLGVHFVFNKSNRDEVENAWHKLRLTR